MYSITFTNQYRLATLNPNDKWVSLKSLVEEDTIGLIFKVEINLFGILVHLKQGTVILLQTKSRPRHRTQKQAIVQPCMVTITSTITRTRRAIEKAIKNRLSCDAYQGEDEFVPLHFL